MTHETLDRYVQYLREEYETPRGKPLNDYSLHQYVKVVKIMAGWGTRGKRFWSSFPLHGYELPNFVDGDIQPHSRRELKALLDACGSTSSFMGRRMHAMLLVALDTGVRRGELRQITLDMIDLSTGRIRLAASITKSKKARTVHLQRAALEAVKQWLVARNALPGVHTHIGPLFCQLDGSLISDNAINELAVRLRSRSGVNRFRWHLMRHTSGTESLRHGADSLDVQETLGHASSAMTRRYLHLTDDDRRERHARYSPVQALLGKNEPKENRFKRRSA